MSDWKTIVVSKQKYEFTNEPVPRSLISSATVVRWKKKRSAGYFVRSSLINEPLNIFILPIRQNVRNVMQIMVL